MRSKKPKAVELTKWLTHKGVEKVVKEKQRAIDAERHKVHEKDSQLALLNDDLQEQDTQLKLLNDNFTEAQQNVVALEKNNVELQAEVERLTRRAVPHLEDPRKDGMVIIQKNNSDPYPYITICGQQGYVAQKIQHKLVDYPNGQIVVLSETPNAIVHYNWLRERGCIVANPDRVRHFILGENYTHQRLIELQEV